MWPLDAESPIDVQRELARAPAERWQPARGELRIGGCWLCSRVASGDVEVRGRGVGRGCGHVRWHRARPQVRRGVAGAPYSPETLPKVGESACICRSKCIESCVIVGGRTWSLPCHPASDSARSWVCVLKVPNREPSSPELVRVLVLTSFRW